MGQKSWAGKALDGEAAANSWDDNLFTQLIITVHSPHSPLQSSWTWLRQQRRASGGTCGSSRCAQGTSIQSVPACVTTRLVGLRPSSDGQRCDCFPHVCWLSHRPVWAPTPLSAYQQWISESSAHTKPACSGHRDGLTRQSKSQCCSVADSLVCARGKWRWKLPVPRDNPTAPISMEEFPQQLLLSAGHP